jgi:hypothetical protein
MWQLCKLTQAYLSDTRFWAEGCILIRWQRRKECLEASKDKFRHHFGLFQEMVEGLEIDETQGFLQYRFVLL